MDTNQEEFTTVTSRKTGFRSKNANFKNANSKNSQNEFYTMGKITQSFVEQNSGINVNRRQHIKEFNKEFGVKFNTVKECIDYGKRVHYATSNIMNITEKDLPDTCDFLTNANLKENSIKNKAGNELDVTGFINIMKGPSLQALKLEYVKKKIIITCGEKKIVVFERGPCRYFQQGNCPNGKNCLFSHVKQLNIPDSSSSSEESEEESEEEPKEEPKEEPEEEPEDEPKPEPEPEKEDSDSDSD